MRCISKIVCLFGLVLTLFTGAGIAADDSKKAITAPLSSWSFQFTPYLWAVQFDGDVAVAGQNVSIDGSFLDIIDESDSLAGWISYFEARKEKLYLFGDIVYADLTFSADAAASIRLLPSATLSLSGQGELDYSFLVAEAGAGYEIARWDRNSGYSKTAWSQSFSALDVYGGLRYWRQDADLALAIQGTLTVNLPVIGFQRSGNLAVAGGATIDWVDPFVGLRYRQQFAPGRTLSVRGDIGSFGADSDFTWQLAAIYNHEIKKRENYSLTGTLGYRALSVDYTEGAGINRFEFDLLKHGPIIGLSVRF